MAQQPDRTPSSIELRQHLWEVWQYRHGFFWGSLIRWGIAVVSVSAVPHIYPRFVTTGAWVLLFPVTAVLLTVFSFIHLLAEHQRLAFATDEYLSVTEPRPVDGSSPPAAWPHPRSRFVTGIGVIIVYLAALLLLSVINGVYLTSAKARAAAELELQSSK